MPRLPVLALLLLALGEPLGAQTVVGRLVDQASQEPVPAGTVQLLAADSTQVGVVLTDAAGAFRLPAPGPGQYYLAEIGRASWRERVWNYEGARNLEKNKGGNRGAHYDNNNRQGRAVAM